ncbi:hypothetical protein [Sphingomonas sp. DT-204]|uniref:hypothetical protein n=1 Tax=Sphingomonas sp. DT-204 TaxID=3396166 RepID=UPI003F1ABEC8
MNIKLWTVAMAITLAAPAIGAQDLPTDQLERHADVVRQDMLLKSTLRHSRARQAGRSANRATPSQVAACAKKAQFRAQYGADHAKVKKLYALCRAVGL